MSHHLPVSAVFSDPLVRLHTATVSLSAVLNARAKWFLILPRLISGYSVGTSDLDRHPQVSDVCQPPVLPFVLAHLIDGDLGWVPGFCACPMLLNVDLD